MPMQMRKDLTGRKFGRLTALDFAFIDDKGGAVWNCRCECGVVKALPARSLNFGTARSCGCLSRIKDLTGRKFERFTVLGYAFRDADNRAVWNCRCDCGVVKAIPAKYLGKAMTYEVFWKCHLCSASGTVSIPYSEACDSLWNEAVEQHATASPDCNQVHGTSGLAIRADQGAWPA
jgi:hypothetical protein